jgi:uncharacterized protein (DUF1697 family)
MITYVAFLRGIGGPATRVKMQVLKEAFERMGFRNVRTVIASGNVIFDAGPVGEQDLEGVIEKALPEAVGFEAETFVLTLAELQRLARSNPLRNGKVSRKNWPFVTFLKEVPKSMPKLSGRGFKVAGRRGRALFSLVDLSPEANTDLMSLLDKAFGKKTTTRSWKTIAKILQKKSPLVE